MPVQIPTGVSLPKKSRHVNPVNTPPVLTHDDFRDAFMVHYKKCRRGRMASLRAVYDFAVWFDAAAQSVKGLTPFTRSGRWSKVCGRLTGCDGGIRPYADTGFWQPTNGRMSPSSAV